MFQAEPEDCCEDGSPGHVDGGWDSPGQGLPRKVQTAQNGTEEPADDTELKPCLFPFPVELPGDIRSSGHGANL